MSSNGNQATSSGARDLAIMCVILLVLFGGIGLTATVLISRLFEEPEQATTSVAEKPIATEVVPTTTTTTTTTAPPPPPEPEPEPEPKPEPEQVRRPPSASVEVKPPKPAAAVPPVAEKEPPRQQKAAPPAPPSKRVASVPVVKPKPKPKPVDPKLAAALEDLASGNAANISNAIRTLRRFTKEEKAFNALSRLAVQRGSSEIRLEAIGALRYFKEHNPSTVCLRAVKARDEDVVKAGMDLAGESAFAGYEVIYTHGLRHKSTNVRRHALMGIRRHKVIGAEKQTARIARYDSDRTMRQYALQALNAMRSKQALSLLRNMLAGKNRSDKYQAVSYLTGWEGDPQALDLLYRYRNDRDVGKRIQEHLARHGR